MTSSPAFTRFRFFVNMYLNTASLLRRINQTYIGFSTTKIPGEICFSTDKGEVGPPQRLKCLLMETTLLSEKAIYGCKWWDTSVNWLNRYREDLDRCHTLPNNYKTKKIYFWNVVAAERKTYREFETGQLSLSSTTTHSVIRTVPKFTIWRYVFCLERSKRSSWRTCRAHSAVFDHPPWL